MLPHQMFQGASWAAPAHSSAQIKTKCFFIWRIWSVGPLNLPIYIRTAAVIPVTSDVVGGPLMKKKTFFLPKQIQTNAIKVIKRGFFSS